MSNRRPGRRGEVFSLGSEWEMAANQILRMLAAITGYRREPIYGPRKVGETFRICLKAEWVRQAWDWEPQVDREEGLERTVAFCKERWRP
ncbi:hypothetical protein [Thermoflexus sp.]|uniref:hypothetical protein n=1 Tax=Thermoflexus sp. TaxID=1969742 RepID=UPI0035E42C5A